MKYALTIIVVVLLFSCSKTDPSKATIHLARSDKKLTTLLPVTQQLGIQELDQTALTPQQVTYVFSGRVSGTFTYEQLSNDEMNLTLHQAGNLLKLYGDRGKKTLIYNGINLLEDKVNLSLPEQTEVALALTLYREVTDGELERTPSSPASTAREEFATCNYTAMSFRISRSSSVDHLTQYVDN